MGKRKRRLLHNERWKVLNGTVQMGAVSSWSMVEMETWKGRLLDDTAVDSEMARGVNARSSR